MGDEAAIQAYRGRSVISVEDFSKAEILALLETCSRLDRHVRSGRPAPRTLGGRLLGILFFEPSTRTRLSFESAMLRLGGASLGVAEARTSSLTKGESLADTIRVVEPYCDALVLRHPREGSARLAAQVASIPVINGGDGSNQHPTQTFLDLYTIRMATGRLDGLRIGFLGDLRYGRAVHSLMTALLPFDVRLTFIGPEALRLPSDLRAAAEKAGRLEEEVQDLEAAPDLDLLYVTRIQVERFPDPLDFERIRSAYRVDRAALERFGPEIKIMHPLPRAGEVARDVDLHPGALYFEQSRNGVVVRMALLHLILAGPEGLP